MREFSDEEWSRIIDVAEEAEALINSKMSDPDMNIHTCVMLLSIRAGTGRGDFEACTIIDRLTTRAKQWIAGRHLIFDGRQRRQ